MAQDRSQPRPDPGVTGLARGAAPHAQPTGADPPPVASDGIGDPARVPIGSPDAAQPRMAFSPWQLVGALLIAAASDLIGGGIDATVAGVPATIPIDILTALALWAMLGRPVLLLVALIAEALPGIGVLPLWTAVVVAIAMTGGIPSRIAR